MISLNELSIHEAIALYYEKHHAMKQGDMKKLIELKNQWPEIFDKKIDEKLLGIINYIKKFQHTSRYKSLSQKKVKDKLSLVQNDTLKEE